MSLLYLVVIVATLILSLLHALPTFVPLRGLTIALLRRLQSMRYHGGTRFIILSTPRSGSTLLVNLLAAHPEIRCKGEILNRLYEWYPDVTSSSMARRLLHVAATLAGDVMTEIKG